VSDRLDSVACATGHVEPEADAVSTFIHFFGGGETRAGIPLVGGVLDESARRSLDEAMVGGEYREIGPPAWDSKVDAARELSGFRIVIDSKLRRVEHGGKLVFEHTDWYLPRYSRTCSARAWSLAAGIVIERTCRTVDEGVEVLGIDVLRCDSTRCRG
jgi:hypothetical protein